MKSRLLLILVFSFLLGCKKECLILPYTKGYIYSKKEGKPIKNAAFYSPYIGSKFKNDILVKSSVNTDDN
jgi:lipoprotein